MGMIENLHNLPFYVVIYVDSASSKIIYVYIYAYIYKGKQKVHKTSASCLVDLNEKHAILFLRGLMHLLSSITWLYISLNLFE